MVVSHLSEDEQTLIEVLCEIALEKVAPRATEIDHTAHFAWDMKELLAQHTKRLVRSGVSLVLDPVTKSPLRRRSNCGIALATAI